MPHKHVAPRERARHTQIQSCHCSLYSNNQLELCHWSQSNRQLHISQRPWYTAEGNKIAGDIVGMESFTLRNKLITPNIFSKFPFSLFLNSCNYKHTHPFTDKDVGHKRKAEVYYKMITIITATLERMRKKVPMEVLQIILYSKIVDPTHRSIEGRHRGQHFSDSIVMSIRQIYLTSSMAWEANISLAYGHTARLFVYAVCYGQTMPW